MRSADRALLQHTLVYAPKLKFYDAISLWHKAGKCFAVAAEWEESAIAFARAAEYMAKLGNPHEAAVYWFKSAEVHRRIDVLGSVQRYDKSIAGYIEVLRFGTAANLTVALAEIYEEERQWEKAIERYDVAAEYYVAEKLNSQACDCLMKLANLTALLEKFEDASFAFERAVELMVDDNRLRLNIPQVYLRAGLCLLANGGNIQEGLYSHKVLRYYMKIWAKTYYQFDCSREKLFLENLLRTIAKGDMDAFADQVYNFDNVAGLESWHLKLLARCKEDVEEEVERRQDVEDAKEAEKQRKAEERAASFVSDYHK